MAQARAWSFLTIEGDRVYQGNKGYTDKPESAYPYDNYVGNHRQVKKGDIAVIRSETEVLGIAEIEDIEKGTGTKEHLRCPNCGKTKIQPRKTIKPPWRCSRCRHEFEKPDRESVAITTFEARYGSTFKACSPSLTLEFLAAAVKRPADQASIEEIELAKIEQFLGDDAASLIERFAGKLEPPQFDDIGEEGEPGSKTDRRRKVLREISVRRGQSKFRNKLIKRYGGVCQVSGCDFVEIVEAAHIDPYSESGDNSVGNGLLLRSDIHTLFDLGYLGIKPDTLKIRLHPAINGSEYEQVDGADLLIKDTRGPTPKVLEKRWSFFQEKCATV